MQSVKRIALLMDHFKESHQPINPGHIKLKSQNNIPLNLISDYYSTLQEVI